MFLLLSFPVSRTFLNMRSTHFIAYCRMTLTFNLSMFKRLLAERDLIFSPIESSISTKKSWTSYNSYHQTFVVTNVHLMNHYCLRTFVQIRLDCFQLQGHFHVVGKENTFNTDCCQLHSRKVQWEQMELVGCTDRVDLCLCLSRFWSPGKRYF